MKSALYWIAGSVCTLLVLNAVFASADSKTPAPTPQPTPQAIQETPTIPAPSAPKPTPTPTPIPKETPKPPAPKPTPEKPKQSCDPNYSGCVPIDSDVDCAGGSGNGPSYVRGPITVIGSDIYDLDRDNDGTACE